MKANRLLSVLSGVMLVALLFTGIAAAKTTRTDFSGVEYQIGGEDPLKYWEAGTTSHLRGLVGVYAEVSTDQRVSGTNTTVANINFHPGPAGMEAQFWGTYRLENENGYWSGTFQGSIAADGSTMYRAHGNGGGSYQGLMVHIEAHSPEGGPTTFTGYIQDPGK